MTQQNSFKSDSKFWATNFFPKGIGRSGHFNKEQTNLLENHGVAYEALADGSREPVSEEEVAFVLVFQGQKEAQTKHERTWKRFLEVTDQKHRMHYSVGSSSAPSVDFSAQVDAGEL